MTNTGLTIFATPKPFRGHIGVIQRNAITSWTKLQPRPEVILLGSEEGAAEFAAELGLVHIREVRRNSHGTPLLADVFGQAEGRAGGDVLAYVNSDIILPREFPKAVEMVRQRFPKFLAVGRRTNLDVREPIEFAEAWEERLKDRVRREGQLESPTGIDLFAFPRGMYERIPPLVIGRVWFDQWCIKYARKKGIPVIDLTEFAPIVHQLHDYNHVPGGKERGVYGGAEADENLVHYGERPHTYTIMSATHCMKSDGKISRVFLRKEISDVRDFLWERLVHRTHPVRRRIGLAGQAQPAKDGKEAAKN
jgi:hypothetical protein